MVPPAGFEAAAHGNTLDDRAAGRPLADWWPGYLTFVQARCRPSTVANYEHAWRLRISPQFGTVAVRHIKASSVADWLSAVTANGASASKVIEAHGVLKRVLDRPVRDGVLAANPCATRRGALPSSDPGYEPMKNRVLELHAIADGAGNHARAT